MHNKAKPTPIKYCQFCGKKLERKDYGRRLEDLGVFNRRKYCDADCMRKAFVKQGDNGQKYSPAHHSARRILYNIYGKERKCEICGSTTNVDVHHIDGNFSNNNIDNLMLLCRSCHMKAHRNVSKCKYCDNKVKAHGLCNKHYIMFKKYGDPLHKPWSSYRTKTNN